MQKPTPVLPSTAVLSPASINEVRIDGGFWGRLQDLNREATIPHEVKWLEKFGTLSNFDAVKDGTAHEKHVGRQFADSDAYKVLEAIAWETGREASPDLEATAQELVQRILPALREDGYLNTQFGNPGQQDRYTDMEWGHELYCYGHLIQAGVARLRTGHDSTDPLAKLALTVADHVCRTFGEDGLQLVCGHPEIEVALVELARVTGNQRYLDQAQLFIDRRGHHTLGTIEFGQSYFQDERPIRDIEVMHGHAVRALYLAAGAIDVATETGDHQLLASIEAQYLRTLERRTYITGGMGSHHQDEAFGEDFELPADRAYCETCAGVASIMVAWRLLLATGNISFGDIIERTLYNIVATSVSEEGTAFFYANPLHQRILNEAVDPEAVSLRAGSSQRASWFEVSCCPPNVSRTLAQLGSYVATSNESGVQLIQYVSGLVEITGVRLAVDTQYPNDDTIRIRVEEAPDRWQLTLRVPAWASEASVTVNGVVRQAQPPSATISDLRPGDEVILTLPLTPRFIHPDMRIDGVRGCVAVESGPLVYCLESALQPDHADIATTQVDTSLPLSRQGQRIVAQGRAVRTASQRNWPYSRRETQPEFDDIRIVFSPYWSWANNGPTTMRVWVPRVS